MKQFANKMLFVVVPISLMPIYKAYSQKKQPNILLALADDWGGQHAGVYEDKLVKTPVFDKLAKSGILFQHAYCSSPSSSPSRAALLTGQYNWRLEEAASLYGSIPAEMPLYTDSLEKAGYFVGYTGKGWGPGHDGNRKHNPAGKQFKDFDTFLAERPKDKPFCFWFGSHDPHRPYVLNSGAESGINLDEIKVPPYFPDNTIVRGDLADYYFAVQRYDYETGQLIEQVRKSGELINTIIVMTSDNGMPFPRCKSNIYENGVHVPLAIYWQGHFEGGCIVSDFVSLCDLAPTFLNVAGIHVPKIMTGKSLIPQLTAKKNGRVQASRNHILFGKERHVPSQPAPESGGYPCRAIRTDKYLLIHNFEQKRWPAGSEDYQHAFFPGAWYADCDNGPTKYYMIAFKDKDTDSKHLYDLSFAKRPEYELYDMEKDPYQLQNLAKNPAYQKEFINLSKQLNKELTETKDPRIIGGAEKFDIYPYNGVAPQFNQYEIFMKSAKW